LREQEETIGVDDTAPGAVGTEPAQGPEAAAQDGEGAEALREREAALSAVQAEIEALTDSHQRLAADFANYRRRVERDRGDWEEGARGDLLLRLLPVFDNLRRARAAADGSQGADAAVAALAAGLDMVLRGLDEALMGVGLRESVRVGEPFDPATCEAIGEEATDAVAPGHVSAVLQPGYRLGERVLRAALVRVAAAPQGAAPEGAAAEGNGGSGPAGAN
jgi:molecular chaperone GrpE